MSKKWLVAQLIVASDFVLGAVLLAHDMTTGPATIVGAFILAFSTMIGLVVWIVKRLFDTTIPEQQRLFREELNQERAFSREHLSRQNELFLTVNNALMSKLDHQGQAILAHQVVVQKTLEVASEHYRGSAQLWSEFREFMAAEEARRQGGGA